MVKQRKPVRMRRYLLAFGKWFGLPALIYFIFFYLFNPNLWGQFSNQFYIDSGDGLQNVWNIWWVNKSVVEQVDLPWHTEYLYWPFGISLWPQTMNAFNGFLAIPLINLLGFSLVQAVNFVVVFSYVMTGITMLWLAYYLTRSYVAALIAGFAFTFSSFHMAHGVGHMQMITLEWVPLFLLFWVMLLRQPRHLYALGAGLSLGLVVLSDFYFFFYSVIAAGILLVYEYFTKQFPLTRRTVSILATFAAISLFAGGWVVLSLIYLNRLDPLTGSHPAKVFGMDALAWLIHGGSWYWKTLTDWYWARIPGHTAESSVYLGLTTIALVLVAFFRRKQLKLPGWINAWFIIGVVFGVLSLGPRLRVFGKMAEFIPLPYAFVEKIFPPLQISGVPVRMMVMVILAAAVISALVIAKINLRNRKGVALVVIIAALLVIELRPSPIPLTPPLQPEYVSVLKSLPDGNAGIIDNAAESAPWALYYQTVHEKPMAFGYTTRTPESVEAAAFHVYADWKEGRAHLLCSRYRIRYMVTRTAQDFDFPVIYQANDGTGIRIYDLKTNDDC